MAYSESLAIRIREKLILTKKVEEKKMMGGLTFMVKGKMCCGIVNDELMVRMTHDRYEEALSHPHAREMDFTGKPMKGFVFVSEPGYKSEKDLAYWVGLGLQFIELSPTKKAKRAPKPTKKTKIPLKKVKATRRLTKPAKKKK